MKKSESIRARAKRFNKSRSWSAAGRYLLLCELLEPRQLLAVDSLNGAALVDQGVLQEFTAGIVSVAEDVSHSSKRESELAESKSLHYFSASGTIKAVSISDARFVLPISQGYGPNRDWARDFGLRPVRSVGELHTVFELTELSSPDFASELDFWIAPVFVSRETGSEAVLLDELIVALKPGVDETKYFESEPEFRSYRSLAGTNDQFVATLSGGKGIEALNALNRLSEDLNVAWIAPNFHQSWQKYFTPNDPRFANQWHLSNTGQAGGLVDADADLTEAWDVIQGGSSSITIGVIDDGVSTDHPDLNPWVNSGEVAGNGQDDDGNGWVDDVHGWNFVANNNQSFHTTVSDAHGTSVAGVAAAKGNNGVGVAGAAYNSRVLSAKIFEGGLVASDANIASALYYAAGRKASGVGTWKAADIVNNSWGGGLASTAINAALNWGTTLGREGKGAAYLFATGNGFSGVSEPALQSLNIPGVIAVGATNNFGTLSDYSNTGPAVDLVAPSNDSRSGYLAIDTTDRIGTEGYDPGDYTGNGVNGFGGTSSATPLATGIGALVLARSEALNIAITPTQLRSLLRSNTDLIDTANQVYDASSGKNHRYGYGRINAGTAVSGIGTAEISVTSSRQELLDAVSTTSIGSIYVGEPIDTAFRIRNQGTSTLNLSGLSVAAGPFSVLRPFSSSALGIGESATVVIRAIPTAVGVATRTVTVLSNDLDEAVFTFDLSLNAIATSIGGGVFEDWNGNGLKDAEDVNRLSGQQVYLDSNNNATYDSNLDTTVYTQNNSIAILDNATVTSTLNVAGFTNYITDVNVSINVTHTYNSDLRVSLVSPWGATVVLFDGVGFSGDNFTNTQLDDEAANAIAAGSAPFTGSFRPAQSLSVLDGEIANGDWSLVITDKFTDDVGQLLNWSLTINSGEQSTRTQSNGYYRFVQLAVGSYSVRTIPLGGTENTGISSHMVTINSPSDMFVDRDFGFGRNNRLYSQVFNDYDGNGLRAPTEPVVPGRELFEDTNGNGILDSLRTNVIQSGVVNLFVPDRTTQFATLNVSGLGTVFDVNVKLNIGMSFNSDLDVFLVHPDGTRVELFTDVGGAGSNFTDTVLDDQSLVFIASSAAPFTGFFRPEGSLSNLNGKGGNGAWRLEVTDDAAGDQATLFNWELSILHGERSVSTTEFGTQYLDLPMSVAADIRLAPLPGWLYTFPSNGLRTVTPTGVPLFDQRFGTKAPPFVSVAQANLVGLEGVSLVNAGSWTDADTPTTGITLSASVGTVIKNDAGTWTWSITPSDQQASTQVTITASDGTGSTGVGSFTYVVNNVAPVVTRSLASVSGDVLTTITNLGTFSDVLADTVTLAASDGNVVNNGNGTWNWSMTPSTSITNRSITITATDEDGGTSFTTFSLDAFVAVSNRKIYYKGSGFESIGGLEAAIDPSKVLLKAGATPQATTFSNVSAYTLGINGIVLDIAGLPSSSLAVSDFVFRMSPTGDGGPVIPSEWARAPDPTVINVTAGNATTPARVRLEWPNNAIQNTWMQIIVKANGNTGLLSRQVFYIGHSLAEVDGESPYRITTLDVGILRALVGNTIVGVSEVRDLDKDRRITTLDVGLLRARVGNTVWLKDATVPEIGSVAEGEWSLGRSDPGEGMSAELPQEFKVDWIDNFFSDVGRDSAFAIAK
jgi:subtilisin-like proprotein convertase family protein